MEGRKTHRHGIDEMINAKRLRVSRVFTFDCGNCIEETESALVEVFRQPLQYVHLKSTSAVFVL